MDISIVEADYNDPKQSKDVLYLLDEYAKDPMGGGEPLSDEVRNNLIAKVSSLSYVFSVLCYIDEEPAGLVNCIEGFSTFACAPVVNIHDVVVTTPYRGLGINAKMFKKVEEIAKLRGACKLTLEVLEGNTPAQQAYVKAGFEGYELDPAMGKAMFWQKKLKA